MRPVAIVITSRLMYWRGSARKYGFARDAFGPVFNFGRFTYYPGGYHKKWADK